MVWVSKVGVARILDPPRPTLKPNQPPVQRVPGLFPGDEVARV